MIDKAKTLDECFKELILKRGWSKNSPYDRRTASRHKKQFLEGTLPDEFKRVYLQSAGYTIVQLGLWIVKTYPVDIKSCGKLLQFALAVFIAGRTFAAVI